MLGLWIPFAFASLFKQDRSEERPDCRHHILERWSLCACAALVLFPTGRQQLVLRKGIGENCRRLFLGFRKLRSEAGRAVG